jgi:hypothetical protein
MLPSDFESCDWQCEHKGRPPAFWRYTKYAACHWLVKFSLRLAEQVEPTRAWRIITSDKHSTVWDGDRLLFEFNFQAMGIPPQECFDLAYKEELAPGKLRVVHLPTYWKTEVRQQRDRGRRTDAPFQPGA